MSERYALPDQVAAEREFVPAQTWWKFEARFNVAAQQRVPAIRGGAHDDEISHHLVWYASQRAGPVTVSQAFLDLAQHLGVAVLAEQSRGRRVHRIVRDDGPPAINVAMRTTASAGKIRRARAA